MSKLSAFLHPVLPEEEDVVVSNRFKDEDGKPVKFRIRPISQEENEEAVELSTKRRKSGEALDSVELSRRLVVLGTVEPDFSSEELCKVYGVLDPLLVPAKMLLSGEYSRLSREIMRISGYQVDILGEAKN